ncbi:ABC-type transporter, ATP-binding protein (ATPase) [Desulforapulum autotrophicum HRM2]|uniref:ABC-type transporter, ATP-binding protein (ATPase) n=1 Tax=Desulforapulum autotrophicum (strain ATCC 43914 / DSM 3382 / VKM B-1955 / HRM2) TaxID=177437 RepID=C0QAQ3_DESAH|nr:ATP-binding cassette domain-containing protein [Desulforapulum autotrophicum]ACN16836.1 ABC-type transporter, ATP-binding protein (ATPase) [Desulforapulum autotrophicum HRM2]
MITLENIKKDFNPGTINEKTVINNLNFKAQKGDFITIVGSNGAGKTTLFNLISGAIFPTRGRILIRDREVTHEPEYKRAKNIGRIFQDPLAGTASNMTLEDNMMITARKGFKWPKISLTRKVSKEFEDRVKVLGMGLEHRLKENVNTLSGGQRQALTLLMTVSSNPDILLLDEHTAALDPGNAALIMELTRQFVREKELTTLMVTHNMNHAIEFGNRLIMMDQGEIIIDVNSEAKRLLTKQRLIEMFGEIKKREFENDEVLLTS